MTWYDPKDNYIHWHFNGIMIQHIVISLPKAPGVCKYSLDMSMTTDSGPQQLESRLWSKHIFIMYYERWMLNCGAKCHKLTISGQKRVNNDQEDVGNQTGINSEKARVSRQVWGSRKHQTLAQGNSIWSLFQSNSLKFNTAKEKLIWFIFIF